MTKLSRKLSVLPLLALTLLIGAPAFALDVGAKAPCVVLKDLQPDGKEINQCLRVHAKNQKFTLLEFFSAVCEDCAKNLPRVSTLAHDIEMTTTTRLVGIDRDEALLRRYVKEHRDLIRFPVSLDTDRDAKKAYGVVQTPTLFVVAYDRDIDASRIVYKHEGVLSDDDIRTIKDIVR